MQQRLHSEFGLARLTVTGDLKIINKQQKQKKRKDYACRHHFNEMLSIIPG